MYTKKSVIRLVRKKGLPDALKILSSLDLSDETKDQLTKESIFIGGFPNVELISTFV